MYRPGTPNVQGNRQPANASTPNDDPSYKTALKGAALAFSKTTPRPSPSPANTPRSHYENDVARIAATSTSREHSLSRSPSRSKAARMSRQTTGNSIQGYSGNDQELDNGTLSRRLMQHLQATSQHQAGSHLMPPGRPPVDPRSPSFIAATLAVSRSATPSPNHTGQMQPSPSQLSSRTSRPASMIEPIPNLDLATDTTPIPPTNALISMFENQGDTTDPVKKGLARSATTKTLGPKPRLRPMTPPRALSPVSKNDEVSPSIMASSVAWQRASSPPTSIKDVPREIAPQPVSSVNIGNQRPQRPPTPPPVRRPKKEAEAPEEPAQVQPKPRPRAITPPSPTRGNTQPVIISPQPRRAPSQKIIAPGDADSLFNVRPAPASKVPPPIKPKPSSRPQSVYDPETRSMKTTSHSRRRSTIVSQRPRRSSSTSSNDTFVSADSSRANSQTRGRPTAPPVATLKQRSSSAHAVASDPRPQPSLPPRRGAQPSTNLPLDSLTSAIVAGSLASARRPATAAPAPPPPPPRRQTPHMRQTLREQRTEPNDDEAWAKRHRTKLGQKGKHAHREGTRKRWREEITERERKRYEGVWASNRGLLLAAPSWDTASVAGSTNTSARGASEGGNSELVANVVVRDIWARSRLPFDELAEVWDLVDSQGKGVLSKPEFVVGMWLIDQRLRGRKIPQRVSESVWGSAKGVTVYGPKVRK